MVHQIATSLPRKHFEALGCLGLSDLPLGELWSLFDSSLLMCLVFMRYTLWDFLELFLQRTSLISDYARFADAYMSI